MISGKKRVGMQDHEQDGKLLSVGESVASNVPSTADAGHFLQ